MTFEEHKARHLMLHRALDELFADFITHHPEEHDFLKMPLERLLKWAFEQTKFPTDSPGSEDYRPLN